MLLIKDYYMLYLNNAPSARLQRDVKPIVTLKVDKALRDFGPICKYLLGIIDIVDIDIALFNRFCKR